MRGIQVIAFSVVVLSLQVAAVVDLDRGQSFPKHKSDRRVPVQRRGARFALQRQFAPLCVMYDADSL